MVGTETVTFRDFSGAFDGDLGSTSTSASKLDVVMSVGADLTLLKTQTIPRENSI